MESGRTPYSVRISTIILKIFLAGWLGKSDVKNLKLPKGERPLPKPLDEKEVLAILAAGSTPYERVLVATLYEGGLRVGEISRIKIGEIALDQYGVKVTVNGKSGERTIRLIQAAPHLQAFLEHHPKRMDPSIPIPRPHLPWSKIQT